MSKKVIIPAKNIQNWRIFAELKLDSIANNKNGIIQAISQSFLFPSFVLYVFGLIKKAIDNIKPLATKIKFKGIKAIDMIPLKIKNIAVNAKNGINHKIDTIEFDILNFTLMTMIFSVTFGSIATMATIGISPARMSKYYNGDYYHSEKGGNYNQLFHNFSFVKHYIPSKGLKCQT